MNTTMTIAKAKEYKVPSFNVLHNNKRVETLEHCFIEHMLLFCPDPPAYIKAKNGVAYVAVYDDIILPAETENATIKVIVSFQKHSYGSFAIIRNLKELKKETE